MDLLCFVAVTSADADAGEWRMQRLNGKGEKLAERINALAEKEGEQKSCMMPIPTMPLAFVVVGGAVRER